MFIQTCQQLQKAYLISKNTALVFSSNISQTNTLLKPESPHQPSSPRYPSRVTLSQLHHLHPQSCPLLSPSYSVLSVFICPVLDCPVPADISDRTAAAASPTHREHSERAGALWGFAWPRPPRQLGSGLFALINLSEQWLTDLF